MVAVVPEYRGDLNLTGVGNIKETIEGPGQELLAGAKAIAAEEGAHIMVNLEQGEPYERVIQVAEDERCDLIVMGRRGISHLERAFMGSVTARVIGYTTKEVLVIPESASVAWNNILLATDGSDRSHAAQLKAFDIVKSYNGHLAALSVVDVNEEFFALAHQAVLEMVNKAGSQLETLRAEAAAAGLAAEIAVREGSTPEVVADHAATIGATVIVMGSHGRRGLHKFLMGSATERVIGFAHCPVLVAHST